MIKNLHSHPTTEKGERRRKEERERDGRTPINDTSNKYSLALAVCIFIYICLRFFCTSDLRYFPSIRTNQCNLSFSSSSSSSSIDQQQQRRRERTTCIRQSSLLTNGNPEQILFVDRHINTRRRRRRRREGEKASFCLASERDAAHV